MLSRQKKFYAAMLAKPVRRRPPPRPKEVFGYAMGRSPLGAILVAVSRHGITAVMIDKSQSALPAKLQSRFPKVILRKDDADARAMLARVVAFIEKPKAKTDLPLDIRGTPFQRRVWMAVLEIPPGKTASYSEIAAAAGARRAVRAVGSTCTRSPMAYIIPCHRVVHAGVGGAEKGSPRKQRFLKWDLKAAKPPKKR
ncbi:MAG TPA: methylated-DNA--[protein]-cysteine S-methyltransferase [Alphaproteobacteria bacterium]|nr:methylated-DNA--[protein]-cysteine S-methyltransferase [Alphaproteobacteria bacterium]